MDNLTPRKIERLLNIAEDINLSSPEKRLLADKELQLLMNHMLREPASVQSLQHCESSSGVFDLDQLNGMEEFQNVTASLCTTFNPVEITGRSTGANMTDRLNLPDISSQGTDLAGILESQSTALPDLMRHSLGVDMTFQSKRDLTADEASFIAREVGLPSGQATYTIRDESQPLSLNNTNVSVGSYFKRRCGEFDKVLPNNESPDRSYMMPSITEVSQSNAFDFGKQPFDDTLDCVPVRQSRQKLVKNSETLFKVPGHLNPEHPKPSSIMKKAELRLPGKSGTMAAHKSFMNSSKPADVLLKNLHTSFRQISDDTEGEENSLSISKIAEFIGKQSNVSITDFLQLGKKNAESRKQPLTEVDMNMQEDSDVHVTNLKDTKKSDTASTAGTMNTVISMEKLKLTDIPEVLVTDDNMQELETEVQSKRTTRSKSPSNRSQSTATTVRDNNNSFRSGHVHSPTHTSPGETNMCKVPSPNLEYKELDKSVDWHDVLLQKRLKREGLAKEQWAEIVAPAVEGFVGVSCPVTIKVTTLTDSWLTAKFQFDTLPDDGKNLSVELPRLPLLLSPGKSEQFTIYLTSYTELQANLPFTIVLKDTSIESDVPQRGNVQVNFKLPAIQAMSANGVNKITFPPILEKRSHMTSFVLLSDCPEDLHLELSVAERDTLFSIMNVQEVKKIEVNKHLLESNARQGAMKSKNNKQLCRLTKGNAIKVVVAFNAPKLVEGQRMEPNVIFKGSLNVNLIGVNTVLKKVDLIGIVGSPNLVIDAPNGKVHVANESTNVSVNNAGSISGSWRVKSTDFAVPFRVHPESFELAPGAGLAMKVSYIGPEDTLSEGTIIIEEIASGKKVKLQLTGGLNKPKFSVFPIKTNHNNMSWVRCGRKEISLMNSHDKKIYIRCMIHGDGFAIDKLGIENKSIVCLSFAPQEKRTLAIVFNPNSNKPYVAELKLSFDRDDDYCRKVPLYGCAGGEGVRWSGLATYGDTALVRAVVRAPIQLKLYNKSAAPAFVCARIHYNLHYSSAARQSELVGGRCTVSARACHVVTVRVDWARVERRARAPAAPAALATVTVLAGNETTRRRILRIIRNKSGELDTSLLPETLRPLAEQFENEDPSIDKELQVFNETKESLEDLIDGLEELTAQIDLPQDFSDDNNTILITDDTVVNYRTLCE